MFTVNPVFSEGIEGWLPLWQKTEVSDRIDVIPFVQMVEHFILL